jgi:hypothetical protein
VWNVNFVVQNDENHASLIPTAKTVAMLQGTFTAIAAASLAASNAVASLPDGAALTAGAVAIACAIVSKTFDGYASEATEIANNVSVS